MNPNNPLDSPVPEHFEKVRLSPWDFAKACEREQVRIKERLKITEDSSLCTNKDTIKS